MTRQRIVTLIAVVAVLLGTGGAVLIARLSSGTAQSGDEPTQAGGSPRAATASGAGSTPPVKVLVPGRPGESAKVTDSDQVRAPDGSTYNTIDTTFVQMMIPHHVQAIEMADLAATRAANPQLRALAERISAAQGPEIKVLRSWLEDRRLPDTDPRHDHSTMPGMQTESAVAALAAASGAEFDRRFVTMMTAHHQGAQQMAGDVLRGGTDLLLSEMANEMAVEQGSEIRRMAQLGVS